MKAEERKDGDQEQEEDAVPEDHHELILEEEQDLNIESTNKVIFELSTLIQ